MGLLVAATALAAEGEWRLSPPLAPAVQQARAGGRLALLKVATVWCPSCRKLERILAEPGVRAGLSGYLRLAYDAEQGEGKDVAERYNVVAFPTLLVVGGDGREAGRVTGDLPGPELLAALEKIRNGSESLAGLEEQARKRPLDLKLRLRVGSEQAFRGARVPASVHLDAVVAGDPDNRQKLAAEALLVKGKFLLLRSLGDYPAAIATLTGLRGRFPSSPEAEQARFPLAQALQRSGKAAEAMRLLSGWARTAEQHDDVAWFCLRERTATSRGLGHAERAVRLDPKLASAWATLAELELRLGRRSRAEAAWARARSLDPGNPRTRGPLPAEEP